jgi:hypothetical protein
MFCPKCGADGEGSPNYCRRCGVNLALVGKAVTVSEVIARGDSGLLPKIKTAMGNLKLDDVSAQVAQHVESIGREVERSVRDHRGDLAKAKEEIRKKFRRTPEEQRAHLVGKGFSSLFSGIAMMIVLYVVGHNVHFNFPPDVLAKVPFDLYKAIDLAWIFGLIPALAGFGQVIASLFIPKTPPMPAVPDTTNTTPLLEATPSDELFATPPPSITEDTTAQLDYEAVPRRNPQSTHG